MADMYDSRGNLLPGSSSLNQKAKEETAAGKKRKNEAGWNQRFWAHKGMSGMGGASKADAYRKAHPNWKEERDRWAHSQVKPKKKKPATGGANLSDLMK